MGGKKKGGLANRLARMTDDERAKYLQRKADMEEEARRRKEQLVANFMKNKLKKEDAFSRLNMAKINQYWHHIMRADKCTDMKQEVEHLRKWIERTVKLKNRTIKKLMDELDWQEELYGKNFTAHAEHVDKIIEFHNKNLDQVCQQYQDDRRFLLHIGATERKDFEERTGSEIEHLKTIIHGQEVETKLSEKENHETYIKHIDEMLSTYRTELSQMRKSREKISCALWRQISRILTAYVHQTDVRRSHLAELRRLDTEGAVAIAKNQQQIVHEEEQAEKLKHEYSVLFELREDQIKDLENTVKVTTSRFFQMRKNLCFEINLDEKQLTFLTNVSNDVIDNLKKLSAKGEQILQMAQTCRKFETEDEKHNRWVPYITDDDVIEDESDKKSSLGSDDSQTSEQKPKDSKYYKPRFPGETFSRTLEESDERFTSKDSEESSSAKDPSLTEGSSFDSFQPGSVPEKSAAETDTKELSVFGSKTGIITSKGRPGTSLPKSSSPKQALRKFKSEELFKKSQEQPIFQISTNLIKTKSSQEKPIKVTRKSLSARPTKSAIISRKKISASISRKQSPLVAEEAPQYKPTKFQEFLSYSIPTPTESVSGYSLKSLPIDGGFEGLDKLEGLWWVYSKVEMDCINIREERKRLIRENNKLKEMTRDVLAAAALGKSIPSAKSSSTAISRKRFILSAPLSSY